MGLLDFIKLRNGMGNGKFDIYFPAYERHFSRWQGLSPTVLEIGVDDGNSIAMWHMFFGPHANIYGIDIKDCPPTLANKIYKGDQKDHAFLAQVLEEIGPPDIVIDDGSHIAEDIVASFEFIYPRMTRHGIYLVEDLHATLPFTKTAAELATRLTAQHSSDSLFRRTTMSMHFYESLVFFERGVPGTGRYIPCVPPTAD